MTQLLSQTNHPTRALLCELCRQFYQLGWVSGTGGGIAMRHDDQVLIAPSGVQKERLQPEDLFVLNLEGKVVHRPENPALKVSECQPLFWHAFKKRNAAAVLHSHSVWSMLVTKLFDTHFEISNLEMIKGLRGKNNFDVLRIPIINNTPRENELADTLGEAIDANPDVDAVLVRDHGIYVWGETWEKSKTQAECLDYLFKSAVLMKQLNL
jgi:methylthioribulose-1-phosphate dehydratase